MQRELTENVVTDVDPEETQEWLDSLEDVLRRQGPERVQQLLVLLQEKAYREGVTMPFTANTAHGALPNPLSAMLPVTLLMAIIGGVLSSPS